jgi:hypothetical protein
MDNKFNQIFEEAVLKESSSRITELENLVDEYRNDALKLSKKLEEEMGKNVYYKEIIYLPSFSRRYTPESKIEFIAVDDLTEELKLTKEVADAFLKDKLRMEKFILNNRIRAFSYKQFSKKEQK